MGVLVAISIPIFTSQLEKSKEATDMANIRSAYAQVIADYLTDDSEDHSIVVKITSNTKDWKSSNEPKLGTASYKDLINTEGASGSVTVKCSKDGVVTIGSTTIQENAGDTE